MQEITIKVQWKEKATLHHEGDTLERYILHNDIIAYKKQNPYRIAGLIYPNEPGYVELQNIFNKAFHDSKSCNTIIKRVPCQ